MTGRSMYIRNRYASEEYSTVSAYSIGSREGGIKSGASIVQGIYYMWNDQGFIGKGWQYSTNGGPTNIYPDFSSDEDVADYVDKNGNLDAVFKHWSEHYDIDGWHNFYMAVGFESGCMDVDHS